MGYVAARIAARGDHKQTASKTCGVESGTHPSLPPVPIAEVRPTLRVGHRNVFAVASHNRPLSSGRQSEGFTRYRLGTGLQAMQLSPHRAGLAGLRLYALSSPPAFLPCCCPLSFRIR